MRYLSLCLLFLVACSSGGGPTPAPPTPLPPVRPGVIAYSANWTLPIGAHLYCGGPDHNSPFNCTLPVGSNWGVLNLPGNGGQACVDPEPNICFTPSAGALNFSTGEGGMALVSAFTVSPITPVSIEAIVNATLDCTQVSYVGPVLYNGEGLPADPDDPEGNYFALYYSCFGGDPSPKLWIYTPPYAAPISDTVYPNGATLALRMDYMPGLWVKYYVNETLVYTQTPGSPTGTSLTFNAPPRPALWFGNVTGSIGRFDWYTGP